MRHPMVMAAVLVAVALLAGCGGGAGSHNVDYGPGYDSNGNKVITRTLDNQSAYDISVELWVNDRYYIGTVDISAYHATTVEIDRLEPDDYIYYKATFDNGDTTSGIFTEDGRTTFTHSRSRAAGAQALQQNGKDAVSSTAPRKQYDARKAQTR